MLYADWRERLKNSMISSQEKITEINSLPALLYNQKYYTHYSLSKGKFIMQTQYALKQAGLTLPVTKISAAHRYASGRTISANIGQGSGH
jgi:hypothetical protein